MGAVSPLSSAPPLSRARRLERHIPVALALALMVLFGVAVFATDGLALRLAREGWHRIELVQSSFQPSRDARKLYTSSTPSKALDAGRGVLPDLSKAGKFPRVQTRIVVEAARQRQLKPALGFDSSAK